MLLRVVMSKLNGRIDALDQLDDEPARYEDVYVYRRVTEPIHACVRSGKGRGCYETADYEYMALASTEHLRNTEAWREWADQHGRELVGA